MFEQEDSLAVGGQAVIEGVMIRSKDRLAIAVRLPNGEIDVETKSWKSLFDKRLTKRPFLRGFFILLETMVNGIKALNLSASKAIEQEADAKELKGWHIALTLAFSIGFALLLFVVLPHLLSLFLAQGRVESLGFHVWDGIIKVLFLIGYILAITALPDVRRVFSYHGAEHKVIWAHESGAPLEPENIRNFSRLHPRCGTTFLLFVLTLSIIIYSAMVPALLLIYSPENAFLKQTYIIAMKILLMIPISAVAYEIIKLSGLKRHKLWYKALAAPGLFMQKLTTKEPDDEQIKVAVAALRGALDN